MHSLTVGSIDEQHMFPISQAFEGLLPSLGEKKNDGGQFFTPREVIRLIVNVVNPQLGQDGLRPLLRHRRLSNRGLQTSSSGRVLRRHRSET